MTDTVDTSAAAHGVGLSATAADKVRSLLAQEGREDLRLRAALDRLVADVKPISVDLAEARDKMWTPDKENTEPEKKLWTPGSKEPE